MLHVTVDARPPTANLSMCAPGVEESTSDGHARAAPERSERCREDK